MLRAALLALCLSAAPALAEIGIHDPYAITPVPGAPTGAAYMLIHNHGSEPDRLLGARTPAARSAELHHHIEEDGVMRMRPVEGGLELPAGGELALARGGAHVMLVGLEEPLEDGDTLPLTLIFETAGEIEVEVPVDLARLTGDVGGNAHGDHAEHAGEHAHGDHAGHDDHGHDDHGHDDHAAQGEHSHDEAEGGHEHGDEAGHEDH